VEQVVASGNDLGQRVQTAFGSCSLVAGNCSLGVHSDCMQSLTAEVGRKLRGFADIVEEDTLPVPGSECPSGRE